MFLAVMTLLCLRTTLFILFGVMQPVKGTRVIPPSSNILGIWRINGTKMIAEYLKQRNQIIYYQIQQLPLLVQLYTNNPGVGSSILLTSGSQRGFLIIPVSKSVILNTQYILLGHLSTPNNAVIQGQLPGPIGYSVNSCQHVTTNNSSQYSKNFFEECTLSTHSQPLINKLQLIERCD